MCLVLTGIHAYLGLHVIAREVVFVDIALAQIAALGATAAFLWGYDLDSWGSYAFALSFTVLGATVFALTRSRERRVSQEAVIGVVYAVSAAAASSSPTARRTEPSISGACWSAASWP
jgi:zinc/manganese transport system permease protein